MNKKLISLYLKTLRAENGYSQNELAEKLYLTRQAVSKWETETTVPDLDTLLMLSKLYGVTINDILEPKIVPSRLQNFEQIITLPGEVIVHCFSYFEDSDIAKALMGASPKVNEYIAGLFPQLDFKSYQEKLRPIRVTEIEEIHEQIVSFINLESQQFQ